MAHDKEKSSHAPETDNVTGVKTTGHEWDGIKELNNPLPRWWLWVMYATIVWSFGYWVVYPAWPTLSGKGERGGTEGTAKWTEYKKLEKNLAEVKAHRAEYVKKFHAASFDEIMNDPELYAFAMAGGQAAFKDNCATCHGSGGAGGKGFPNLNDDDWLWGGDIQSIYQTVSYGIRIHEKGRQSEMPSFKDTLPAEDIKAVASYVDGLERGESKVYAEKLSEKETAALSKGAKIFRDNCAACHGYDARGGREVGAPNLADAIWLKSDHGGVKAIESQMKHPKHGQMPAWHERLSDDTIRELTVYVHELGGGE
ncbi:MAG: cytochrome-c oxidase, cbb3-type subunit III [Rickettsiales bacterium]